MFKFKDTHREKGPLNKTPTLMKKNEYGYLASWSSNQLFQKIKNFPKNELVTGKNSIFVIGPFCTPHYICLNDTHSEKLDFTQFTTRTY